MAKILGIDTSNYTTSVALVEDGKLVYDFRRLLIVKKGQRGLRQSEALFQHINNLPDIIKGEVFNNIDAVCVSEKPRPVDESYMPVFLAGKNIGECIAGVMNIPLFHTTHQEGHIEAAYQSLNLNINKFIGIHISGGTSEILKVTRDKGYTINKIGGTKDISIGQFIDRIGVLMGFDFPAGRYIDDMATLCNGTGIRIPSKVEKFEFNLSGQETMGINLIKQGYKYEDIAFAVMLCINKTLEKLIKNLNKEYNLPVIITGGVASSNFIKGYINNKVNNVYFCDKKYASDNAVGTAFIGYNKF